MKKKKTASIYTALRIPPELREDAQGQAAKEGRTLSNYIKQLIREDLARAVETPPRYGKRKKK